MNISLTAEQKQEVFEPMFKYFETEEILEYFKEIVTKIPNAIFYKPASSSGKYHNSQQIGEYGQLIHIYMFSDILNMFLDLEYNKHRFSNPIERDLMRCTPALHDMCKYGMVGSRTHTTSKHPLMAKEKLIEINNQKNFNHPLKEDQLKMLCEMCERHSGEWNTWKDKQAFYGYGGNLFDEVTTGEMEKPQNDRDILIHECDMLASRTFLTYDIPDDLIERFKKNIKIK